MRLLIVEDDPKLAAFLQRALQEAGHLADVVSNANQGVEQALRVQYDALVVDWTMPRIDGPTLIRELRERGLSVPTMLLTARAELADRVAGLDAGADDYLTKPFELRELLARIRAITRRGAPSLPLLCTGPLTLDTAEHSVRVDGEELELTSREYDLLAYLMRQAGRAVSRTELLTNVWNLAHDPGSNVIDAQVKNLREKLGPRASVIQTVRGVGYRLSRSIAVASSEAVRIRSFP